MAQGTGPSGLMVRIGVPSGLVAYAALCSVGIMGLPLSKICHPLNQAACSKFSWSIPGDIVLFREFCVILLLLEAECLVKPHHHFDLFVTAAAELKESCCHRRLLS